MVFTKVSRSEAAMEYWTLIKVCTDKASLASVIMILQNRGITVDGKRRIDMCEFYIIFRVGR